MMSPKYSVEIEVITSNVTCYSNMFFLRQKRGYLIIQNYFKRRKNNNSLVSCLKLPVIDEQNY